MSTRPQSNHKHRSRLQKPHPPSITEHHKAPTVPYLNHCVKNMLKGGFGHTTKTEYDSDASIYTDDYKYNTDTDNEDAVEMSIHDSTSQSKKAIITDTIPPKMRHGREPPYHRTPKVRATPIMTSSRKSIPGEIPRKGNESRDRRSAPDQFRPRSCPNATTLLVLRGKCEDKGNELVGSGSDLGESYSVWKVSSYREIVDREYERVFLKRTYEMR